MIINYETVVNVTFGVVKDEEVLQRIPLQVRVPLTEAGFKEALDKILAAKQELIKQEQANSIAPQGEVNANPVGDI